MLVLSRKQNQEIIIGDDIKITVLKVRGNLVRIGIEAPKEVRVVRGELPRHQAEQNLTVEYRSAPSGELKPSGQLRIVHSQDSEEQPTDETVEPTADSPGSLLQNLVTMRALKQSSLTDSQDCSSLDESF